MTEVTYAKDITQDNEAVLTCGCAAFLLVAVAARVSLFYRSAEAQRSAGVA
jgi:hypothetical protein